MRINRSIIVHAYGTHDEFTELVREYETIYGHAAEEVIPPISNTVIRQFTVSSDGDDITLFHGRSN